MNAANLLSIYTTAVRVTGGGAGSLTRDTEAIDEQQQRTMRSTAECTEAVPSLAGHGGGQS